MKLNLTKKERTELEKKGKITVERSFGHIPLSSVHYGTGKKSIFDKVDYVWIYGDTESYKKDYMNVGRRKTDYPDNNRNVWSGGYFWDCESDINSYNIDKPVTNGIKNPITFKIVNVVLDRLEGVRVKDVKFKDGLPKGIDLETIVFKKPVLKYTVTL